MRIFNQLSARARLLTGFLSVAVIAALVGGFGLERLSRLNEASRIMYERDARGQAALLTAGRNVAQLGRTVRQSIFEDKRDVVQVHIRKINELTASSLKLLDFAETTMVKPDGKALVIKAKAQLPEYANAARSVLDDALANRDEDAKLGLARMKTTGDLLEQTVTEAADTKTGVLEATVAGNEALFSFSWNVMIGVVVGALVLAAGLGYFTARWLETALTEVSNIADSFASASQQLSAASEEIASGAQEQASNLEETASSLEEITSTIKQNADSAQQANQLATGAREVAEKGGSVVGEAVEAMKAINHSSKKIAEIITAIDEIAFQTNLLALNAAVEAARAGEQGRGFAVVAGEVRNLAQRSAGAAKEIKELIQDSVRKVDTGSELVNKSGQTLQEIVGAVKRVTDIVSEIAAASQEQSTGVDQVSKAVAQMDQVTQTNASQTEELSGTAESLANKAQQLQELVTRVKSGQGSVEKAAVSRFPVASSRSFSRKLAVRRTEKARVVSDDTPTQELELVGAGDRQFEEF